MVTIVTLWLLSLAMCVSSLAPGADESPIKSTEYELKAVFLHRFLLFTQWPEDHFKRDEEAIELVILGEDPFGKIIDDIMANEKVHGREVKVTRCESVDAITSCDVVFVCASEKDRTEQILAHFAGKTVLMVGETRNFARTGGVLNLKVSDTVEFEVNTNAAKNANIRLDPRLLRLAKIVESKEAD